jgi:protein-S-isoprenylcysteine O-methyltransferase Ste14
VSRVLAITLGQAKTIAAVVVIALLSLAVVSAWVMKEVMQKVALVVIFGLLALLVWTQRSSLQDCADRVREQARAGVSQVDTTCTFLGRDITISTNRDDS